MHHLGSTRSASRRDYLLHAPDSFVRTPLPGLVNGMAIVHAAPRLGAAFAMTTVELEAGGSLASGPAQRFVYVVSGSAEMEMSRKSHRQQLTAGGFAFLPAGCSHTLHAPRSARLLLFEKPYQPLQGGDQQAGPDLLFGDEAAVAPLPLNGDDGVAVRCLLPASPAFDFAVNTMTYAPGASLSQVEVHFMEHGLLMLEGAGIYRLDDDWHPVTAGDAIWMGPFCPQWFAAVGKVPAKYLIYKDFNRHVLA